MYRLIFACVLGLIGPGMAAADGKKVTIRWFGQSYFQITTSAGTRIVLDPHAIKEYPRAIVPADLVLISHPHQDHNQVDVIENRERAKILVGVKGDVRKQEWNLIDEKFKDVKVTSVPLFHDKARGMERGKNSGFVLEFDGLRLAHLGDLGHELSDDQIKSIGHVDILMLPVGGIYTINGTDAKKVVQQLRPKRYILPMHYGTKDFDQLLGPEEFLDEQKLKVEKQLTRNELIVDAGAKPPTEPVIVLLGWKKPE
jgi:L-ascorbate metabolism protein UlaG (beta-lactamase superfamily)